MADTNTDILQAIHAIRGSGRFAASGRRPFMLPGLTLPDGEELAFPLPKAQANSIKAQAEAAPYGKGTKTLHDTSVRKCWQLDANELSWAPEWDAVIQEIVKAVAKDLGVEGQVVAEPYKLLLYEKGGLFLPHKDTEKLNAMFASFIVALPSSHGGGSLHVRHDGREKVIDFSKSPGCREIQYAAFFADCEHEVKKVTAGYRLCLAYNLRLKKGSPASLNLPLTVQAGKLVPVLKLLKTSSPTDLTAILLDHQYTEANLSVAGLKNDDSARARALFAAAKEVGMRAHLALISLYQMGNLEGGFDYRGRYDHSERDGTMGEIFEESLSIDHWRTPGDKVTKLGVYHIEPSRVIGKEVLGDGDPDEQEEEGYTGNAGCTMEYWYHHAAIVFWPKEAEESVLVRYNFRGACSQLGQIATAKGAATKPKFLALARALIQHVEDKVADAADFPHRRIHIGEDALPIIRTVIASKSAPLLEECQSSLIPLVLDLADDKLWKTLFKAFGHAFFASYFKRPIEDLGEISLDALFSAMSAMLQSPPLSEAEASLLANRMAELLLLSRQGAQHRMRRRDQNRLTDIECMHIALGASFLVTARKDQKALREVILSDASLAHVRDCLGPGLQLKTLRIYFKKADSDAPEIRKRTLQIMEAEVARPLEPYPDWKRPFTSFSGFVSSRQTIDELRAFMVDPGTETYRFKAVQTVRSAVEDYVKNAQLDLDLRTERKGSPHTLVCQKNDASYQRAMTQRQEDKRLLKKLRALTY